MIKTNRIDPEAYEAPLSKPNRTKRIDRMPKRIREHTEAYRRMRDEEDEMTGTRYAA